MACFLPVFLLSACSAEKEEPARSRASAREYALTGEVIRLQPDTGVAAIKHNEIPGWMEAMTMEFPLESHDDLRRLKPGDRIRARVFVQDLDYWLGDVVVEGAQR